MRRAKAFPRFATLLAILSATQLAGQAPASDPTAPSLTGRVLDEAGRPLAGIPIQLHRVLPQGGTVLSSDTSDAAGGFSLAFGDGPSTDAIYFASAMIDGRLHVGTPFRAPIPGGAEYVLIVGEDAGASVPGAVGTNGPDGGVLAAIVLVGTGLGLLGWAWHLRRRGPARPAWRDALIRAAAWEEYAATAGEAASPGTRAALRRRARDAIMRGLDAARP